jgi:hypothetical protein
MNRCHLASLLQSILWSFASARYPARMWKPE